MKASEIKNTRIIVGLARFASAMLSPMLMPTYGVLLVLWTSYMSSLDLGLRVTILLVIFGITCILPMFFIAMLHQFKIIKDKRLISSKERLYPYIFALLCYIGACFYLDHVHAPKWFIMFCAGGTLAVVVSLVVNLWWKISAHMAGICGIVALIYYMHLQMLEAFSLLWVMVVAVLLAGALGSARIILKRHTFWQVMAGAANGYICVKLMMSLFG